MTDIIALIDTYEREIDEGFATLVEAAGPRAKEDVVFVRLLEVAISRTGMRQIDLAELFGCTNSTISRWVDGSHLPHKSYRIDILQKLAAHVLELSAKEQPSHPQAIASPRAQASKPII